MKGKRLFTLLLALALCVGLLPGTASAVETPDGHTHCICAGTTDIGDHTTHTDVEFTAWTDVLAVTQNGTGKTAENSLPKTAGNYYLTKTLQSAVHGSLPPTLFFV